MGKLVKRQNKIKNGLSDRTFNTILLIILTIWLIIVLYPIIYVLSSSFSSGEAVSTGRVLLWPVEFSVIGYELVFQNSSVWTGYANTILYTVVGTILNVFITILCAYPLSRSNYQGRKFFTLYYMIPMYFGGGLIPTYMLVSKLGLVNTRTYIIISGALGLGNMIIMRTAFKTNVPTELLESAKMDGISDIGYLFKILLPLSKATISVITLYYMVDRWNTYFVGLVYLRDRTKYPLQLVLNEILSASKVDSSTFTDPTILAKISGATDVMKYALIVVSSVPMLIVYPFVQKFFEKGVMVGSVKG